MPYIVTTTRRMVANDRNLTRSTEVSRRAVDTLEDARAQALSVADGYRWTHPGSISDHDWRRLIENSGAIPEPGGSFGPLPDGTVIEVEPVTEFDLKIKALVSPRATVAEAVAAYNTAQEGQGAAMGPVDGMPARDELVHRIAAELDMPSLYMGGPSLPSRRKAERIVDLLPDYQGAIEAERDWCERILHADQRGDERVLATLAQAAAARLAELGEQ